MILYYHDYYKHEVGINTAIDWIHSTDRGFSSPTRRNAMRIDRKIERRCLRMIPTSTCLGLFRDDFRPQPEHGMARLNEIRSPNLKSIAKKGILFDTEGF